MASTGTLWVDGVASNGTRCGGRRREHRYTVWWMAWRAPVHHAVDGVASTGTRCAGWRGEPLPVVLSAPSPLARDSRYTVKMQCERELDLLRMWLAVARFASPAKKYDSASASQQGSFNYCPPRHRIPFDSRHEGST